MGTLDRLRQALSLDPPDTGAIYDGMARALFVSTWADRQGELRSAGRKHKHPGAGGDWMDIAPPTPRSAKVAAAKLAEAYEKLNGKSMEALWLDAALSDELDFNDRRARVDFGHYLAMQSLGHGVSWFDSHASFPLKVPHTEFYL